MCNEAESKAGRREAGSNGCAVGTKRVHLEYDGVPVVVHLHSSRAVRHVMRIPCEVNVSVQDRCEYDVAVAGYTHQMQALCGRAARAQNMYRFAHADTDTVEGSAALTMPPVSPELAFHAHQNQLSCE